MCDIRQNGIIQDTLMCVISDKMGLSRILLCVWYKTKWGYPGYSYVCGIRQIGIIQDTLICVV